MLRFDLPRACASSLWVASKPPVRRLASKQRYANSWNVPSDSNVKAFRKPFPAANQPEGSFKRSLPSSKETFGAFIGLSPAANQPVEAEKTRGDGPPGAAIL